MNGLRDAILLGTREAAEIHSAFGIRDGVTRTNGSVDVFGVIEKLEVPILFRPLDGLLGACIRVSDKTAGILVTTKRDLHMQRFTAAHELGHLVLRHDGSLDREIAFPGHARDRDLQEVAADAFAAEFLMPKWLFIHHARRHRWTSQQLADPQNVYQLSLRMGVSYEAACFGLQAHKVLDGATVDGLRRVPPKQSKLNLLQGVSLADPWADVWRLDVGDHDGLLDAGPRDVFVAELLEHSGGGYLWDVDPEKVPGFSLVQDIIEPTADSAVGGHHRRRVVLRGFESGVHRLSLVERRPWESGPGSALHALSVMVSTHGAEVEGLARRSHNNEHMH